MSNQSEMQQLTVKSLAYGITELNGLLIIPISNEAYGPGIIL